MGYGMRDDGADLGFLEGESVGEPWIDNVDGIPASLPCSRPFPLASSGSVSLFLCPFATLCGYPLPETQEVLP